MKKEKFYVCSIVVHIMSVVLLVVSSCGMVPNPSVEDPDSEIPRSITIVENVDIEPIVIANSGETPSECIPMNLPEGLTVAIQNMNCVISGRPADQSTTTVYNVIITARSNGGMARSMIDITVVNEIRGTANADNPLNGGPLSDIIRGQGGNDVINAGSGNDIIFGGSGSDAINGGDGRDTAEYGLPATFTLSGNSGNLSIMLGADTDMLSEVEVIQFSSNNNLDTVNIAPGTDLSGILLNGGLNERIRNILNLPDPASGSAGYTLSENVHTNFWEIQGGSGNDTINGNTTGTEPIQIRYFGNNGNDTIIGGNGRELLRGGEGDDTLDGGGGNDGYLGGTGADTFVVSPGMDSISDLEMGDTIDYTVHYPNCTPEISPASRSIVLTVPLDENRSQLSLANTRIRGGIFDLIDITTEMGRQRVLALVRLSPPGGGECEYRP